jgi:hypothetical protein
MEYKAISGECVVTDHSGDLLWRGKPEGYRVVWAQAIPDGEEGWVL